MTLLRVVCHQLAPRIGDTHYNRTLTERSIRAAASLNAQVIVLPELVQSGYMFTDLEEAHEASETRDGPTLSLWKSLAQALGIIIVASYAV